MSRIFTLVVGSFLLLPLQAPENGPEVPKVAYQDLKKDPEKYHKRLVQIEGTLASDPVGSLKTRVQWYILRLVEAPEMPIRSDFSSQNLKNGDRVLVTGTFRFSANASGKPSLGLHLQSPTGRVKKLSPKP